MKRSTAQSFIITLLRIVIGWHFLYEGIVKLLNPNWSSAGYLMSSDWFLSSIFQRIAESQGILSIVDFLNIWGLILVGLGLLLGLFTRIACISGISLLALYYIANPPFISPDTVTEGHYLVVSKDIIEMMALLMIFLMPANSYWGLDMFLYGKGRKVLKKGKKEIPEKKEDKILENVPCVTQGRREVLKKLISIPFMGAFIYAVIKRHKLVSNEELQLRTMAAGPVNGVTSASMAPLKFSSPEDLKGPLPQGEIAGRKISRLIFGGNLIAGVAHARDLIYVSPLVSKYFSDKKIIDSWFLAENCGINAMTAWPSDRMVKLYKLYKKLGGEINWIGHTGVSKNNVGIQKCIDNGAIGIYIAGDIGDKLVYNNQLDEIERSTSFIKQNGLFSGVAGHSVQVHKTIHDAGIDIDFYMKTLHSDKYWSATPKEDRKYNIRYGDPNFHGGRSGLYYDNMWCIEPEETIKLMKDVEKPWMAFKVLAAGALDPYESFKYAFENGADFIHVGMFDFQIVDDVNFTIDVLNNILSRERPWYS